MAQRVSLENLTRRNGFAVFPPAEVAVGTVAAAVAARVGYAGVVAAQRESGGVTVYVAEEAMTERLVETGLTVGELHLRCAPLAAPAVRVALSGAPPFLSDADILRDLERYGTAVSTVAMLPLQTRDPRLAHVLSLRRQVFMVLRDGNVDLDVNFKYTVQGHAYTVYASTAGMRCYGCGGNGHARRNCPNRASEPAAPAVPPATGLAEQQQRPQQQRCHQLSQEEEQQSQQQQGERRSHLAVPAADCGARTTEDEQDIFVRPSAPPRRRKRRARSDHAAAGSGRAPAKQTVVAGDNSKPEDRTDAATGSDDGPPGPRDETSDDTADLTRRTTSR